MKNRRLRGLAGCLVCTILGGFFCLPVYATTGKEYLRDLKNIDSIIEGNGIKADITNETEVYNMFLSSFNANIHFTSNAELERAGRVHYMERNYGIIINENTANYTIGEIVHGSPAAKAGIREGDVVVGINQVISQEGINSQLDSLMKSPQVTSSVTVRRSDADIIVKLSASGEILEDVIYRMEPNGVGYIRLDGMGKNCSDNIGVALEELKKKGMKSFVLDLRCFNKANVENLEKASEVLLPKGALLDQLQKNEQITEYVVKQGTSDLPFAILIDKRTSGANAVLTCAYRKIPQVAIIGELQNSEVPVYNEVHSDKPLGLISIETGIFTGRSAYEDPYLQIDRDYGYSESYVVKDEDFRELMSGDSVMLATDGWIYASRIMLYYMGLVKAVPGGDLNEETALVMKSRGYLSGDTISLEGYRLLQEDAQQFFSNISKRDRALEHAVKLKK